MKIVTIILNEGPDSPRSLMGLRVADGMLDVNMGVKLVLLDDAVYCAKNGQKTPEGSADLSSHEKITRLSNLGVTVLTCGMCMEARGLTRQNLTEGAKECCLMDVCNSIKESDKILVF